MEKGRNKVRMKGERSNEIEQEVRKEGRKKECTRGNMARWAKRK